MKLIKITVAAAALCSLLLVSCRGAEKSSSVSAERNAFPVVEVPGVYTEKTDISNYYLNHYWDAFFKLQPSSEETLVRGVAKGNLEQALSDFIAVASSAPAETGRRVMKKLYSSLENAGEKDRQTFDEMVSLVSRYLYDPNSPYRNEDLYQPFVEELSESGLVDPAMKAAYAYDARMCSLNSVGSQAADFIMRDAAGKDFSLSSIDADYTLLFFSNPGCSACARITDLLSHTPDIQRMEKNGSLAVVSVYIDEDLDKWREYLSSYPDSWIVAYDPSSIIREDQIYNVRAIPSLYVLDRDKNVIMKDAPEEKVYNYLVRKSRISVKSEIWGTAPDGKEILKYTITNSKGARVELSNVGAGIVGIWVPDRDGLIENVARSMEDAVAYYNDNACMGKVPGRFANRIAYGKFILDGKQYELPINNGQHHLHGGPEGFHKQIWESCIKDDGVEFTYVAKDGEMGYPGNITVTARYDWSDTDELRLTFSAGTDAATVLNLTNHVYMNLSAKGSSLQHELKINASRYLAVDNTLIPEGDPASVEGTAMDFRTAKAVSRDLTGRRGYDHCFVLDNYKKGRLQEAADLYDPQSGRAVKILTTMPGIQLYTARQGRDYDTVALECQYFPDSPNRADFPSCVVRPGDRYSEVIVWDFSTR